MPGAMPGSGYCLQRRWHRTHGEHRDLHRYRNSPLAAIFVVACVIGYLPTDPLKREAGCNPLPSYCHTSVASIQHHNMMIYQPKCETLYRVTWYGGESTILRFEKKIAGEWKELSVQTLMYGIPTGIKELYQEMQDVYNYGITMEQDTLVGTIF
jgi:hypothetical protein